MVREQTHRKSDSYDDEDTNHASRMSLNVETGSAFGSDTMSPPVSPPIFKTSSNGSATSASEAEILSGSEHDNEDETSLPEPLEVTPEDEGKGMKSKYS